MKITKERATQVLKEHADDGVLLSEVGDSKNPERIARINGMLDEVLAYLGGKMTA